MKNINSIQVKVEFTEGYQQRFTEACLKVLDDRKKINRLSTQLSTELSTVTGKKEQ